MDKIIPMIILAGGFGTRLQMHDATRPKPMVLVNNMPFLYWLIQFYYNQGIKEFILSTHHMAEQIENYNWKIHFPNANFKMEREKSPLGTGGAIQEIFKNNSNLKEAWVVNGDTLLPQPLPAIPQDIQAMYCVLKENEVFDAKPNIITKSNRVVGLKEGADYFDAGVVWVTKNAVEQSKHEPPCGLHQTLESSMKNGEVGFCIMPGTCYDIGTPERLKRFENDLEKILKSKKNDK